MRMVYCWTVSLSLASPVAAAAPSESPSSASVRYTRPDDPLADPQWHARERRLRIATGVFAGLSAGALISFIAVNAAHPHALCDECPDFDPEMMARDAARDRGFDRAIVGLGVAAGVSMLGLVIAGAGYDRHLEPAAQYQTLVRQREPRTDMLWHRRDRRLTRGMRATAALSGIFGISSMIVWPFHAEAHTGGPAVAGGILSGLGVINLVALIALAATRRADRKRIERWPQLTAGGLTFRF